MDEGDLFPSFDVDIEGMIELLKEKNYEKVLLQVPEGLKRGALSLAEHIERETRARVFVDAEISYGACDHAGTRARLLGIEAVLHLGHAEIPSMSSECSVPVHFFPTFMKIEMGPILRGLEEVLERSKDKRFGIATTVQHVGAMEILKDELKKRGRMGVVGGPGSREDLPGQVLGCSFHSPRSVSQEVDSYIYLGTGNFHPVGMVNAVKKPVWGIDPMTGAVTGYGEKDLEDFLRKRWAAISKAREWIEKEGRIGIVLGTKPGQKREALAGDILNTCLSKGCRTSMLVLDHVDPMKLRSLGVDVAVITACPRIAYDDISRYISENVVVVTYQEALIALGVEEWENYTFDEKW
ncbi:MAG: diphthamide biosynthesis enzyme Dph2 [Thermoplasmatota archaeon]